MKKLYETDGSNYNGYAYVLYMFVTAVMQMIAAKPDLYREYYAQVKQKHLSFLPIMQSEMFRFIQVIKKLLAQIVMGGQSKMFKIKQQLSL